MKLKQFILALITFFSISIAAAYFSISQAEPKKADGEYIAGISVQDLSKEEIRTLIESEVEQWQQDSDFLIAKSEYEQWKIPKAMFDFSIEDTLKDLEAETKRRWSNFLRKPDHVNIPLNVKVNLSVDEELMLPAYIDVKAVLKHAEQVASHLGKENIALKYKQDPKQIFEKVADIKLNVTNHSKTFMEYAANNINGTIIEPYSRFSFIDMLDMNDTLAYSQKDINLLASAIYSLALQTNVKIIEHHVKNIMPDYTEAGLEATVNKKNKNLIFYNPNQSAYLLQAEFKKRQLHFTLHTFPSDKRYAYEITNRKEIKPKTIKRYSHKLAPGKKEVIQAGVAGASLDVYRVSYQGDAELDREFIRSHYYPPKHEIILYSLQERKNDEDQQDNLAKTNETTPEDLEIAKDLNETAELPELSLNTSDSVKQEEEFEKVKKHYCEGETVKNKMGEFLNEAPELKQMLCENDQDDLIGLFIEWLKLTETLDKQLNEQLIIKEKKTDNRKIEEQQ